MTQCIRCGAKMEEREGQVSYDALPGTVLLGVTIAECPECGETETAIPEMAGLNRKLAQLLVEQDTRLTPDEIKFLRKYLGLSGEDLARRMGVSPETVSRWENGHRNMSESNERLLRLIAAHESPVEDYRSALPGHEFGDPQPWEAKLSADDGWEPRSVA